MIDIDFVLFAISEKTSQIKTAQEDRARMLEVERDELIRIAVEHYERNPNSWREENTQLP